MGKKILVVCTSENPQLGSTKTGLYLSELTHFVEVVAKAGFEVDIASPKGGKIPIDESSNTASHLSDPATAWFMNESKLKKQLENSMKVKSAKVKDYVAIYLAGGHGTMFDFRSNADLQAKITEFHTAGKILSAICHGIAGFCDAKDKNGELIVKGKNVTGFTNREDVIAGYMNVLPFWLETELKNNGALFNSNWIPFTSRVEVADNGKLITGQNPQSGVSIGETVVKYLNEQK